MRAWKTPRFQVSEASLLAFAQSYARSVGSLEKRSAGLDIERLEAEAQGAVGRAIGEADSSAYSEGNSSSSDESSSVDASSTEDESSEEVDAASESDFESDGILSRSDNEGEVGATLSGQGEVHGDVEVTEQQQGDSPSSGFTDEQVAAGVRSQQPCQVPVATEIADGGNSCESAEAAAVGAPSAKRSTELLHLESCPLSRDGHCGGEGEASLDHRLSLLSLSVSTASRASSGEGRDQRDDKKRPARGEEGEEPPQCDLNGGGTRKLIQEL